MVAESLQDRALLGGGFGQLYQGLQELRKERVALPTAFVDVAVHLALIAAAPELHQFANLVNQHSPYYCREVG